MVDVCIYIYIYNIWLKFSGLISFWYGYGQWHYGRFILERRGKWSSIYALHLMKYKWNCQSVLSDILLKIKMQRILLEEVFNVHVYMLDKQFLREMLRHITLPPFRDSRNKATKTPLTCGDAPDAAPSRAHIQNFTDTVTCFYP